MSNMLYKKNVLHETFFFFYREITEAQATEG